MDNGASSYRRFLDGDEKAFDELMKEYFHSLVFFVNRYVHNIHTAEDIAIDTFSELIVHKSRYNFKVSLKTYLFTVGRSRALDYMRRHRSEKLVELSEAYDLPDDGKTLEELVLESEQKRKVNAAVSALPDDMRDVVHLIYFEEMTYKQAARVLKKSPKQVDNLLYKAKKELRTVLGRDGDIL